MNQQSLHNTMQVARSGMNDFIAGIGSSTTQACRQISSSIHSMSHFQHCYKDLDATQMLRLCRIRYRPLLEKLELEIFIINTQVQPTQNIYIKAAMLDSVSVLMAEAAALARSDY
jgi:hypothetical protein